MIDHVIRLDLLQSTLGSLLSTATGATVAWAYTAPKFDEVDGDLVTLRVLSGPTPEQSHARGVGFLPPSEITLTITATAGKLARVVVNRIPYQHEVTDGQTPADVRAALIAAVAEDPEAAFTPVAHADDDKLRLVPNALGSIWQAAITGPLTASVAYGDELVLLTKSRRRMAITVTCYSKNTTVRGGAWRLASRCLAALEDPANALALRDATIGIYGVGSPVDLSAIAGAHWESRVAFDVDLNIEAVTIKPIDRIETVAGSVTATAPATSFTLEISA